MYDAQSQQSLLTSCLASILAGSPRPASRLSGLITLGQGEPLKPLPYSISGAGDLLVLVVRTIAKIFTIHQHGNA